MGLQRDVWFEQGDGGNLTTYKSRKATSKKSAYGVRAQSAIQNQNRDRTVVEEKIHQDNQVC